MRCAVKQVAVPTILTAVILFAVAVIADAQQPKKVPRIGYLTNTPLSIDQDLGDAFRQGLRDLRYVEKKNILIEWRSGDGNADRRRALAAEFVRLKVDVIVAGGTGDIRAAQEATDKIPIVMINGGDAVGNGFVASLARPGGNITGLTNLRPALGGKRLGPLKEIVPKLSRVAVFASSTSGDYEQVLKESELAASAFSVKVQSFDLLSPKDFESAFQTAVKGRAEAVLVRVPAPILSPGRKEVAELAVKSRLPVIYETPAEVDVGGLMCYGSRPFHH